MAGRAGRQGAATPAPGPAPGLAQTAAGERGPAFAADLVRWQGVDGRHGLPWQGTQDPYRVWLSEVMLQQTQVSTVLAYYPRFLDRFPSVAALAAAPLDDVLAAWAGLGYYSRARHLHRCAQTVMAEHGGCFPATAVALQALPGIGRSTAAAIAAFCFSERAAILDGNVKRVLTRVLGYAGDLADARCERELWAAAEMLLPAAAAMPAYTQGLMDLGATLCLARQPRCPACPVRAHCAAAAAGNPGAFPVKTRKLKRGRRENWWLWLVCGEAVWLEQRPARGVWAGLWGLPMFDTEASLQQAAAEAAAACGGVALLPEPLPVIEHALTHFDWVLRPWRAELPPAAAAEARAPAPPGRNGRWVRRAELATLALPAPLQRLLAGG